MQNSKSLCKRETILTASCRNIHATPKKFQNKKAIINVQSKRNNEFLKWAIRASLFSAPKGKNPCRTTSYPTEDRISYSRIAFPTPLKDLDKLEAQNENIALNVFGWNGRVTVHRITNKPKWKPVITLWWPWMKILGSFPSWEALALCCTTKENMKEEGTAACGAC